MRRWWWLAGVALRLGPGRMIAMGRARLGLGRIALYLALTTVFSVPILGYLSYGSLPNYLPMWSRAARFWRCILGW
ncbi:MAG: hypothetical protein R3D46_04855 [Defluviimonas denitrificans]